MLVSFKLKLFLYFCLGDGMVVEEEFENFFCGLENFVGEMWSLIVLGIDGCNMLLLLFGFNKSLNFVFSGSGLSEFFLDSEIGLVFFSFFFVFLVVCSVFLLFSVISFYGFMVMWKFGFLLISVEEGECLFFFIFMDSFFWWFC